MRYKTGEMVFLKGKLENIGAVRIGKLDSSGMYELPEYDMWVSEDSIDHNASEKLNGGFVMRYKKGDRVVLRTDLEDGEWFGPVVWRDVYDYGAATGVVIDEVDESDRTYLLESDFWISEETINHTATAELNEQPALRYKVGDYVILNESTLSTDEGDKVKVDNIEVHWTGVDIYVYDGMFRFQFTDDMIDHDATLLLSLKETLDGELREEPFETDGVSDDSLSLTLALHGAKEYRDKLEELHRHIETVERTIEQLNEMDMTIEVEER